MKAALVLAALVLGSVTAQAQGVKVKKALEAAKTEVSSYSTQLKEKCGHDVKATVDEKSFGTDLEQLNTASWGKDTMWAIASLCEDADYKDAISKQVKNVVFKYDPSLKGDGSATKYGNKFELKGGTLTHSYNKGSANIGDQSREFLKASL